MPFCISLLVLRLRRQSARIAESEQRLKTTLESIGDAVITTDTDVRITFMNATAEALTGWSSTDAIGRGLAEVLWVVYEGTDQVMPSKVVECLRVQKPELQVEGVELITRTGERRSIRKIASPMSNLSGTVIGAVLVCHDITESRRLQRQLTHAAIHDDLTGLENRRSFERHLEGACKDIDDKRQHAVCFIDLDRFKIVNDSAGHAAGDALLQRIGQVIQRHARRQDVTARIGGDEFGLLLLDCPLAEAEVIANKIVAAIGTMPFAWDGRVYEVGASAGLTMISDSSFAASELLSQADIACYAAKALGRNRVAIYRLGASEAHRHLRELQVAASIRDAIDENRFRLYAQEIRSLKPRSTPDRHFELLLRLVDRDGNIVEPSGFIPAAERFDMMGSIDRWVIRTALGVYGARIAADPHLSISLNLSANSLNNPQMWPFLENELRASHLPASRLRLEITETGLINNMAASTNLLASARAAGCAIVLDDFGTGLSSFSYLRSFPIEYLKIDGSFMRQLKDNPVDRAIVESINEIGHKLGARTIAEWVADVPTLEILRGIGVDEVQGYVVGPAIALDELLSGAPRTVVPMHRARSAVA